jgi:hypothetical protein
MSGLFDGRRYTVPDVATGLSLPEERIIESAALDQANAGAAASLSEQATASERRDQGLEDRAPAALKTGEVISEGPRSFWTWSLNRARGHPPSPTWSTRSLPT